MTLHNWPPSTKHNSLVGFRLAGDFGRIVPCFISRSDPRVAILAASNAEYALTPIIDETPSFNCWLAVTFLERKS